MTAPGIALDVAGATVAFGETVAVDDVSLEVPAGTTTAILGPSGSGKSSLLRAIAGLEPMVSGRVSIDGQDQAGVTIDKRNLGMMFQDHALFPHLDVTANVGFGLKMRGEGGPVAEARVAEVLDLVGLAAFGARDVSTLSGGEAQRVALARALAPSPRVLLLDEPLGSLDRVLREELVDELRALFARLEVTVLHVTHDQQEAFALAQHVAVMRSGRIAQRGAPTDLWHRPRDTFVAEFLGHPNIWSSPNGAVLAPVPSLAVTADAQSGELGRVTIAQGIVIDAAFREGRWRLTVREASGPKRRIVVDSDVQHAVGDTVFVRIDQDDLHPLVEG